MPGDGVCFIGFGRSQVARIWIVDDTGCINFVFN